VMGVFGGAAGAGSDSGIGAGVGAAALRSLSSVGAGCRRGQHQRCKTPRA